MQAALQPQGRAPALLSQASLDRAKAVGHWHGGISGRGWKEPGVGTGLQVGEDGVPKPQVWCENADLLSPFACHPRGFYCVLQLFSFLLGSALFILKEKQKFSGLQELNEWRDLAALWQEC